MGGIEYILTLPHVFSFAYCSNSPETIMDQVLQQQLTKATEIIESQVDAEIQRLDNLDGDELEILRQRRLTALKKQREKEDEWRRVSCRKYKQ